MEDYTLIIKTAITLVFMLISVFFVPWLKSITDSNTLNKMEKIAKIGVYAAEQLFTPEQYAEKKIYVQNFMAKRGYNVDLQEVDALIEASVLELHNQLKKQEVK